MTQIYNCPQCNEQLQSDALYCGKCGNQTKMMENFAKHQSGKPLKSKLNTPPKKPPVILISSLLLALWPLMMFIAGIFLLYEKEITPGLIVCALGLTGSILSYLVFNAKLWAATFALVLMLSFMLFNVSRAADITNNFILIMKIIQGINVVLLSLAIKNIKEYKLATALYSILKSQDLLVNDKNLKQFKVYLSEKLKKPFKLKSKYPFEWESEFLHGGGSKKDYEQQKTEKASYKDVFLYQEFASELNNKNGLYVVVKRPKDGKEFSIPLHKLKSAESKSSFMENSGTYFKANNIKNLKLYTTWLQKNKEVTKVPCT